MALYCSPYFVVSLDQQTSRTRNTILGSNHYGILCRRTDRLGIWKSRTRIDTSQPGEQPFGMYYHNGRLTGREHDNLQTERGYKDRGWYQNRIK